jgi:short chain dehydrogenase
MSADSAVAHPNPPFPDQQQERPGSTDQMTPRPDHGEHSYRGNGKLNGRVALITGRDSGIGRAVAIAFAREGADVLVSYLCEDQEAKKTAHWVEEAGKRALIVAGDVGDPAHCRELVKRAVDVFGGRGYRATCG